MRIVKKHKHRRCKQPGTPVTPVSVSAPPILEQVVSHSAMSSFGSSQHDVEVAYKLFHEHIHRRAHHQKIQLRQNLKDSGVATSSQREAKVSRLYHHEVLRGYRSALIEVIGAWHKTTATLRDQQRQRHV
eukprot:gb/GEZJ01001878.1/.p1 GENE.gb/GEZJ01001878.1/~~gb/GEZJ01001878.1/.p1  ORF type:complete len:143 (-),score=21.86 gb/GEZJ01001878.1/:597-986(-)